MLAGMLVTMGRSSARLAFRRRLVMATLTATVIAAMPWAGAGTAAAGPSDDIPGIELPGPVAAGRLGGDIYDVVYRVVIPAGHVIVASLSGTEETDFDLYLFDSSATTVLSDVGLLTKSTGPDSNESISWPSRLGGTYYIDLNGATDVEGDYRLTVQAVPDPTPPQVSVVLAGGRIVTRDLAVPVTLTATEDLSGVTEMAFSTDGVAFGAWVSFQASTTWAFPVGDGPRALWVKVRNGVGIESAPASDAIIVDTTPPSLVSVAPAPGSTVAGLRPTLRAVFNEAIDPASWVDAGLIVQSASGALIAGSYSYDGPTRTGSYVPSSALQAGASYAVTVGLVRDAAGNLISPTSSWSITPLAATSLTAATNPRAIALGGSARVHVQLGGVPSASSIEMLTSVAGGPFQLVSTFALEDDEFSILVAPGRNATYRFRYAGTFGVSPAQVDVPVYVRRAVVLVGRRPNVASTARVGRAVTITAAASPAAAGLSISFRLYRFDPGRRAWVYAGSKGRSSDANGRASLTWVPPSSGSFYWRATVSSSADFANNTSPVYRWAVAR